MTMLYRADDSTKPTANITPKTLVATVALVLSLHITVATALMSMPGIVNKPITPIQPLDIQLIKLPKQAKPLPEKKQPKFEPTSEPKIQTKSEPKRLPINKVEPTAPTTQKPVTKIDSKPEASPKPEVQSAPKVAQKFMPTNKSTKPESKLANNIGQPQPKVVIPSEQPVNTKKILTTQTDAAEITAKQQMQQAEKAAQQKHTQIPQSAENHHQAEVTQQQEARLKAEAAQEQAEQQQLAQQAQQRKNAEKQAHERAQLAKLQQQAEQDQLAKQKVQQVERDRIKAEHAKQTTQNNSPVSFGNGDAQWQSKPNINFSGNLARIVQEENLSSLGVKLNVSATGNVTSVAITRSSGNSQIDNTVRQRLQSAKLKPFMRNGVAVAGIGNLTIQLN